MPTIKDVFEQEVGHLKVNAALVTKITRWEQGFVNSNDETLEFLGGVLIGTPKFRFHTSTRNALFDEIMEVDDEVLREELIQLDTVFEDRNVSSDVFNLSIVWLVHKLQVSTNLSARVKEQGQMALLKMLHYRFLGSQMALNFRYEADRAVATATYAELNYKFSLKKHGSWAKLIEARCADILHQKSIHHNTIVRFGPDDQIAYVLSDAQSRLREVVKKIVHVFYEVQKSGTKFRTKSSMVEIEGALKVRDLVRKTNQYLDYAKSSMANRSSFIRPELVSIITDAATTLSERSLSNILEYMVDNQGVKGDKDVNAFVEETVLHALSYIDSRRKDFARGIDLADLLSKLRNLYTSSLSKDKSLVKTRDLGTKIATRVSKLNNRRVSNVSQIAAMRTGAMMYIVLRTFSMDYYAQSGSLEGYHFDDLDFAWRFFEDVA